MATGLGDIARLRSILAICWLVLAGAPFVAAAADTTDRIGVPGPLRFGDTEFVLQWSSNPSPALYKQEYLPAGQRAERYDSMLLVDVRPLDGDVVQTARGMIEQIEARKASDPVANFDVLVNETGDEVLLDFLLSAQDDAGIIVEWNAYRYRPGPDGRGTAMIGISRRGYGEAARAFLVELKAKRARDIETLAGMQPVEVRLPAR
ncbi:hypothetical protein [Luteimonas deserti]|uniref:DUF695 domain-containing protein n=1 Tax=Luteimonas deserti TaxID=2752306 RepID=A0A7Z0TZZ5_9GAMM|nr:hypothetical protein [Luteimonas deserti]NYZ63937.1 hypothetical protein [Luteimonas deserti]